MVIFAYCSRAATRHTFLSISALAKRTGIALCYDNYHQDCDQALYISKQVMETPHTNPFNLLYTPYSKMAVNKLFFCLHVN